MLHLEYQIGLHVHSHHREHPIKQSMKWISIDFQQAQIYPTSGLKLKNAYQKIDFLISQSKHMLWVLKRTISTRVKTVLLSTQNIYRWHKAKHIVLRTDLGPNTLKSIQIHYNYFDLSMITITLQLQDL